MLLLKIAASFALLTTAATSTADDGATSIAAGGLVARRETSIVMAKELLRIGEKKIVVDYDFRNDTNENVATEVAFPVPPYEFGSDERNIGDASFRNFEIWIDEKPVRYETESKALLNGRDVSAILREKQIDIPSCGHFRPQGDHGSYRDESPDFDRLPLAERQRLVKQGLFYDANEGGCKWAAKLNYHWTQTFPAHSTVHIRHEYSPVLGYSQVFLEEIESSLAGKPPSSEQLANETLKSFCVDQPLLHALQAGLKLGQLRAGPKDQSYFVLSREWVDFILTTANTGKQPIEDFTLVIERPKPKEGEQELISLCSPGKGEKLDADHFRVHLANFIPKAELHIGFFAIPVANAAGIKKK